MDNDDAYIHLPNDEVLFFTLGIGILLILMPTLIWLAMVFLRHRE
ncbi:hypothetical protein AB0J35_27920 [Nonomuraea angiospora]